MTVAGQNVGTSRANPYIAGDSARLRFAIVEVDAAGVETGQMSLVGATVRWQLFATGPGGFTGAPLLEKTTGGNGVTIVNAAGGVFEVTIVPADTAGLAPDLYYHEAEVTDATGNVATVATGAFQISAGAIV